MLARFVSCQQFKQWRGLDAALRRQPRQKLLPLGQDCFRLITGADLLAAIAQLVCQLACAVFLQCPLERIGETGHRHQDLSAASECSRSAQDRPSLQEECLQFWMLMLSMSSSLLSAKPLEYNADKITRCISREIMEFGTQFSVG
jgi:hypothetical protein